MNLRAFNFIEQKYVYGNIENLFFIDTIWRCLKILIALSGNLLIFKIHKCKFDLKDISSTTKQNSNARKFLNSSANKICSSSLEKII